MKTILIVDDEPAARYALRRALESRYRMAEADSAAAARGLLTTDKPDLLLLDVSIGGSANRNRDAFEQRFNDLVGLVEAELRKPFQEPLRSKPRLATAVSQ